MFRLPQPITGGTGAKKYYTEALARDDYYRGRGVGQEIAGDWGGKGAALLGLSGEVDSKAFAALCDNVNPSTGDRLTARTRTGRRVGSDANYHVPKGLSTLLAVLMAGEDHELVGKIVDAFRVSMRESVEEDLQPLMSVRVRSKGRNEDRATGSIVFAEFVHFTSRPVGGIPDPHLHGHCFIFNATHDGRGWKAGQFGEIMKQRPYIQAAFHARLSKRLADLGLPIERTAKGWDIAGVPATAKAKFSRRTAQIEDEARKRGITDPKRKNNLGAWTREKKNPEITADRLKEIWLERLTPSELAILRGIGELRYHDLERQEVTPEQCIAHARAHVFERDSAVPVKRFVSEALGFGPGQVSPAQIKQAMKEDDHLLIAEIDGELMVTSRSLVVEERRLIEMGRSERGAHEPLKAGRHRIKDAKLRGPGGGDQRAAVEHILGSRDGIIAVRGRAGTGKTSLMREAADAIETAGRKDGRKVFVFAPGSEAARGVLRREGFAEADTVARLLADRKVQDGVAGGVVWVDEAGQIGVPDMLRILEIAKAQNARVVLSYDRKQHGAIARGDAVGKLEKNGGVVPVEVGKIHRQAGAEKYLEVVQDLAAGRTDAALDKLEGMAAVFEIGDDKTRYRAVALRYADTGEERKFSGTGSRRRETPKTALVVAPTHRERKLVTDDIRRELKKRSVLRGPDRPLLQLEGLKLTMAEKADGRSFEAGQWLTFNQNVAKGVTRAGFERWVGTGGGYGMPERGITRGERYEIVGPTRHGGVLMRGEGGELLAVPLDRPGTFEVNAARRLPVAAGELVRLTKGGRSLDGHELRNGATYRVDGFTRGGNLRLSNGWEIDAAYGHLDHGYTMTSHAAQGSTVDRVLVCQDSGSGRAANAEQFYVSVSRGRQSVEVFTDDRAKLRASIRVSSEPVSASAVVEARTGKAAQTQPKPASSSKAKRLMNAVQALERFADHAERMELPTSELYAKHRHRRGDRGRARRVEPSLDRPNLEGVEPDD